jgi:cytochrome P450 family 49 subfamily A
MYPIELINRPLIRMYPVVIGNGRMTTSDTTISGYHVPKGVRRKIFIL